MDYPRFGLASGLFFGSYEAFGRLTIAPVLPELALPSLNDFTKAFFLLVLPQIPLTFGNSIVATADTARRYFGPRGEMVTRSGSPFPWGSPTFWPALPVPPPCVTEPAA